jgi:hypothetical protein
MTMCIAASTLVAPAVIGETLAAQSDPSAGIESAHDWVSAGGRAENERI